MHVCISGMPLFSHVKNPCFSFKFKALLQDDESFLGYACEVGSLEVVMYLCEGCGRLLLSKTDSVSDLYIELVVSVCTKTFGRTKLVFERAVRFNLHYQGFKQRSFQNC
jgi:hypothetical protein